MFLHLQIIFSLINETLNNFYFHIMCAGGLQSINLVSHLFDFILTCLRKRVFYSMQRT